MLSDGYPQSVVIGNCQCKFPTWLEISEYDFNTTPGAHFEGLFHYLVEDILLRPCSVLCNGVSIITLKFRNFPGRRRLLSHSFIFTKPITASFIFWPIRNPTSSKWLMIWYNGSSSENRSLSSLSIWRYDISLILGQDVDWEKAQIIFSFSLKNRSSPRLLLWPRTICPIFRRQTRLNPSLSVVFC